MNESWSTGILIGLPVLVFFILASIALAVFCFRKDANRKKDTYYDDRIFKYIGIGFSALAIFLVISGLVGYYPYKSEYHKWVPKQGEVADVDRRIVSDGDSMSEKIVVTYADGAQYGCNDTRCASLEKGDSLTLTCQRTWQYAGVDGYDCNFVEVRKHG